MSEKWWEVELGINSHVWLDVESLTLSEIAGSWCILLIFIDVLRSPVREMISHLVCPSTENLARVQVNEREDEMGDK